MKSLDELYPPDITGSFCYCWLKDDGTSGRSDSFRELESLEEALESCKKSANSSKKFHWVESIHELDSVKCEDIELIKCKPFNDGNFWLAYKFDNYVILKYGNYVRYLPISLFSENCQIKTPKSNLDYAKIDIDSYWFSIGFMVGCGKIKVRLAMVHPARVEYSELMFKEITDQDLYIYSDFIDEDKHEKTWGTKWTINFKEQPPEIYDDLCAGIPLNNDGVTINTNNNTWTVYNNFYCEDLLRMGLRPGFNVDNLDEIIKNVSEIHKESFLRGYNYDK